LCDRRERKLEIDGSGHGINEVQLFLLLVALILEGRSAVLRHQAVHLVLRLCVSGLLGVDVIGRRNEQMRELCG
jgi:hypothetical protein